MDMDHIVILMMCTVFASMDCGLDQWDSLPIRNATPTSYTITHEVGSIWLSSRRPPVKRYILGARYLASYIIS